MSFAAFCFSHHCLLNLEEFLKFSFQFCFKMIDVVTFCNDGHTIVTGVDLC